MKPRILTKKDSYTFDYPAVIEFCNTQRDILWTENEFSVSKDVQDLLVNMPEADSHGVKEVLKLFTLYELIVGGEYWNGRFKRMFPRPEFQRLASTNGYVELNVHAPFYAELDKALMLNTDEHYQSYHHDKALRDRIEFIEAAVTDKNELKSIGAFSMTEGAILYSNFAFLKHFQANGKDQIKNVVAGISMSVTDENLHAMSGAWTYKTLRAEALECGYYTQSQVEGVEEDLVKMAHTIYDHECLIIDKIFEKGAITGITDKQMKYFVQHRLDVCLEYLGIAKVFKPKYNPIADWFYSDINSYQMNDFFNAGGSEYTRNWSADSFTWDTSQKINTGEAA